MVAQVNISKSMRHVLGYNDRKLVGGKAILLHAANFLELPEELDLNATMNRFNRLAMLNLRSHSQAVHVSLNFHPSESEKLSGLLLRAIAVDYMAKIGFAEQPYLVYQHLDAGHPHVHIVSTLIRKDGSRIYTHNINIDQSRKAKKELEKGYGLLEAKKTDKEQAIRNIQADMNRSTQIMEYGRIPTKEGMARIIHSVLEQFRCGSYSEFKALLRLYHIAVDRTPESGAVRRNPGLIYQAMTAEGQRIGMPVKASRIPGSPTLGRVESKFRTNHPEREATIQRVQRAVDWTLIRPPRSLDEFIQQMENERISVVVTKESAGGEARFAYVDLLTRSIVEESHLPERCSCSVIMEQLTRDRKVERQRNLRLTPELE